MSRHSTRKWKGTSPRYDFHAFPDSSCTSIFHDFHMNSAKRTKKLFSRIQLGQALRAYNQYKSKIVGWSSLTDLQTATDTGAL